MIDDGTKRKRLSIKFKSRSERSTLTHVMLYFTDGCLQWGNRRTATSRMERWKVKCHAKIIFNFVSAGRYPSRFCYCEKHRALPKFLSEILNDGRFRIFQDFKRSNLISGRNYSIYILDVINVGVLNPVSFLYRLEFASYSFIISSRSRFWLCDNNDHRRR